MKKSVSRVLALALTLLLLLLTACGGTGGSDNNDKTGNGGANNGTVGDSSDTGSGKIRIGLCINSLDETQTRQLEARTQYLEENYPDIELIQISAEGKLENQISIVESFIADGVDVIALVPLDPDGTAVCVDAAHEAGIPCVAFMDRINHDDLDLFIQLPVKQLGALQGDAVSEFLEANPDVNLKAGVILGDVAMQMVWDAREGLDEALAKWADTGRIEIIAEKTANWKTDEAMALTEDWLQTYPEMNCILSFNDEMAFGALQALQAADKKMGEDFYLFGRDGSERGLQELRDGNLAGSVYLDNMGIAIGSVDRLAAFAKGEISGPLADIPWETCMSAISIDNLDAVLAHFENLLAE